MQVILDSSFARSGSAPIRGGKKGEFRDWTRESPKDKFRVNAAMLSRRFRNWRFATTSRL